MKQAPKKNGGLSVIDVYVAKLPENGTILPVYPPERNEEILGVNNERVRKEKYFAWKLLLHALKRSLGLDQSSLSFKRSESGKWTCDKAEFSLSHCENAVAVAVATSPVGVDIERADRRIQPRIADKILSERERAEYAATPETEKNAYLLRKWTEKESVFKSMDKSGFFSSSPKNFSTHTRVSEIVLNEETYTLAVACDPIGSVRVFPHVFR